MSDWDRAKTPAGGNEYATWGSFRDAVAGLFVFLEGVPPTHWHVVFRCGTVVRVDGPGRSGFVGYDDPASSYVFPEHGAGDVQVVSKILDDNCRVWKTQSAIPGDVGRVIRAGYDALVRYGYPYPGGPPADRSPVDTGVRLGDNLRLWFINWPNLGDGSFIIYNLCLTDKDAGAAAVYGGALRRYDYMFPEVGAVITPERVLWMYSPTGAFEPTALPAEGEVD